MTAALATLNQAALVTLADCEQRIERGLKSFLDVGQALTEIRDSRLYKGTHDTFEDYCRERWNLSRPRAYEMIGAAEVVSGMPDIAAPVQNARQAVALGKVPEADRAEVWQEANERTDGKPTAAAVAKVAEELAEAPVASPAETPAVLDVRAEILARLSATGEGMTILGLHRAIGGCTTAEVRAALTALIDEKVATFHGDRVHADRYWLAAEITEEPAEVPPPSALAVTPEQRRQIAEDGERHLAINNARKKADRLVREVSGLVGEIEAGIAYGEPGLVTPEMVAGLREQADRLERYLKEQQ